LAAAEDIDRCGNGGVERGGECEAGPDDEREEDEDDGKIGGALDDVVGVGFGWVRRRAAEIVCDDLPEGAGRALGWRRDEVFAEVAGPDN